MYLDHFGLCEAPFGITPDTLFRFGAGTHEQALTTLQLALREGEGFVKVTGEVGTGKTLLCRTLLTALGDEDGALCITAYVPNPLLKPRELLRVLAGELSLPCDRRGASRDFYEAVEAALVGHAQAGRRVVLCIDEAQAMPLETLEALRLLSNIETGKRKLLQVVLFGQPELDAVLARPECRSLASRIVFAAQLAPLSGAELRHYLAHRMAVAGWRGPEVFGPLARWLLGRLSSGVPRRVNIIAHKTLMLAYGEGRRHARLRDVLAAWRDGRNAVPRRGDVVGVHG